MTPPEPPAPVVVLISGSGTLLQAVLDACGDPAYGVQVAAVGADRDGIAGLERARRRGIPTFVVPVTAYPDRDAWDQALADAIGEHSPALVVSAGFLKLLGSAVLGRFPAVNAHPALLPAFPGTHAVRDALERGVVVAGGTLHWVDDGMDTGPIIDQRPVRVQAGDTEDELHERIKAVERAMLVEHLPRLARDPRRRV